MTLPNFLIIGARKAGTTALYRYLEEHPQIYMSPVKEPQFFSYEGGRPKCNYPDGLPYPVLNIVRSDEARAAMLRGVSVATFTNIEAYETLFDDVSSEIAIGEASPSYLYIEEAPNRILHHIPEAKLIAILRNPVDRAYSHFINARRDGREPIKDFLSAIRKEDERAGLNYDPFWYYKGLGFYYQQLKRYYDLFDTHQIKVILSEDLRDGTLKVLADVFGFLGVNDRYETKCVAKHNIGGLPRNGALYRFVTSQGAFKIILKHLVPQKLYSFMWNLLLTKPALPPPDRRELLSVYRDDIVHLEQLIDRDLSSWLRG
jgi:hypothetical protein